MTTAQLAPTPIFRSVDNNGNPLVGGLLWTYAAGTSTPQASYPSSSEATPNTNPIVLNARGECALWLDPTLSYKLNLTDSLGNTIPGYPVDNIQGLNVLFTSFLTQTVIGDVLYPETAAEIAAGSTPINFWYPPYHVDRYGINTTPGTTSMVMAWTSAVKAAQQAGGIVRYGPGPYFLDGPVNCTFGTSANQYGILIQGNGFSLDHPNFPIIAKHTGVSIFDCTGNDAITFSDVSMTTDAGIFPKTGILFARGNGGGNNSQINNLTRVSIAGSFSVSNYYNYGSEDDVCDACYFANFSTGANTATRIYTANNIANLNSTFVGFKTPPQSCIDHSDFGCKDWNTAATTTSDCISLEQADSFNKDGGWADSGGVEVWGGTGSASGTALTISATSFGSTAAIAAGCLVTGTGVPTGTVIVSGSGNNWVVTTSGGFSSTPTLTIGTIGRSLIRVNLTNASSNYCSVKFTGEQSAYPQAYGILFDNAVSGASKYIPVGWVANGCKLPNGIYAIATGGSNTILDNFAMSGVSAPVGGGVYIPGTLQNSPSFDFGSEIAVTIGSSLRNRLSGETGNLTVTSRGNDYWIDTGAANKSFAPGIATGVHGWTAVGTITQQGNYLLSGNIAYFEIYVSAVTSVACISGATIPTLPFATVQIGYANVVDLTAGTIKVAQVNGTTVTMPAITTTADGIIITGWYFVA